MKIIIPMAGRGSRFAERGVITPKPLLEILGRPMIAWALESVSGIDHSVLLFVILSEHETKYQLKNQLKNLSTSPTIVHVIPEVTDGQLCTILTTRELIDTDEDILIASADTFVRSDLGKDISNRKPDCRGIISVSELPGDQWSFARTGSDDRVIEVAEKVRISNHASTGLYYFSNGKEFVSIAEEMINKGEKTRGEYFVIPVYQKYIDNGFRVDISRATEMWDMGNPEAILAFESHFGKLP